MGRSDYPALRTVNQYHKKYRLLPERQQVEYRTFHWPESMERGNLPWEASEAALELLLWHADNFPLAPSGEVIRYVRELLSGLVPLPGGGTTRPENEIVLGERWPEGVREGDDNG